MERLELLWTEMGISVGRTDILGGSGRAVKGKWGTHFEYIKSDIHIQISNWNYRVCNGIYESRFLGKMMD